MKHTIINRFVLLCACFIVSFGLQAQTITTLEYWTDGNFAQRQQYTPAPGGTVDIAEQIDVSSVPEGIHVLYFRAKDNTGKWSTPQSKLFLKTSTYEGARAIVALEYWIDGDFANREYNAYTGGTVFSLTDKLDMSALDMGIHTLNFRAKDNTGKWSTPQSRLFFKTATYEGAKVVEALEYWVDGDFENRAYSTYTGQTVFSLTDKLDMSALSMGIHTLNFRAKDNTGKWSTPQSKLFFKAAAYAGENLVVGYRYWFDGDIANAQNVTLPTPVNPLELETVIEIPETFVFDEKHVIGMQFLDASGKWSVPVIDTFMRVEPVPHEHSYPDEWTVRTPATCETDGLEFKTCTDKTCGEEITQEIPAIGHAWGEWKITTPATCEMEGEETRICGNDATHEETRRTTSLQHAYPEEWTLRTAAKCETAGVEFKTCSRENCGNEITQQIPAAGHKFTKWIANPANDKEEIEVCAVCGEPSGEIREKTCEHEFTEWEIITPATCTEKGEKIEKCALCQTVGTKKQEIPATGHAWGNWAVTTLATCTAEGEETRICANDATHVETRRTTSLQHAYPAMWTVRTAATCETNGVEFKTCTNATCGNEITQPIPALGHDYKTVVTAPTCTEEGYTTYTCTRGDHEYVANTVAATGHNWGNWQITTPATCKTEGVKTRICKNNATHVETDNYPPLQHTFDKWIPNPANETEEIEVCSLCGEKSGKTRPAPVICKDATATNYGKEGECEYAPSAVTLDFTILTLVVDDIQQLTPTVLPGNATNKTVTWRSSNTAVVTVSNNGLLLAKSKGTATITVTTANGKTATCAVTVNDKVIPCTGVAPLLTTQWNQTAPYNNNCPSVNGQRSVTGCLATAMAQIMNYWAQQGFTNQRIETSIPGYKTPSLQISVPAVAEVSQFDWANMKNKTSEFTTAAQKSAIAELMYECGVSIKMDYTPNGSGAYYGSNVGPVVALRNYFNYDSKIEAVWKGATWNDKLREELNAGRPVFYCGQGPAGGHAFVCDGYKCEDNTFHFNWGWGGIADGYFVTSVLNPNPYDFSRDQYMVANIKPNADDYVPAKVANSISSFSVTATANEGGHITPKGISYVYLGENLTFVFAADLGYEIDEVLINGTADAAAKANGYHSFEFITENHTIEVAFKTVSATTHTISAVAGENGNITPSGNVTVVASVNQPFVFTPNSGYEIAQVLIDNVPNADAKTNGYHIFENVSANHSIVVTFKEATKPAYVISASAGDNGTITPSGEITVTEGDSKTFTFSPNAGYEISVVLVNGTPNAEAKANGYYNFQNVSANCEIVVTFAKTTGIDEIPANNIIVYPNPTKGILTISGVETQCIASLPQTVEIYDNAGRLVGVEYFRPSQSTHGTWVENIRPLPHGTGLTIDISHLPNGIYFIQINGKRVKVVKE